MNAVETRRLSRRFGDNYGIRDVDLDVPAGAALAVVGAPGSGKSTLLRLLVNLLEPTEGAAHVLGIDARQLRAEHFTRIGYIPQDRRLPVDLTVNEWLNYWRPFYRSWDSALESELALWFSLPGERQMRYLTRGMRMKAALLSSVAFRPALLVMDCPFSDIDGGVREEAVHGLWQMRRASECTVIMSVRETVEADGFCDWIALMEGGRLRHLESVEHLRARFRSVSLMTGEGAVPDRPLRASWREWQRSPLGASFIETQYEAETSEQLCRERLPGTVIEARAMSLKEIVDVLQRAVHGAGGGQS